MQALAHKNIPTIIGVQLQKQPISLIIEFKGEDNTSVTKSKLLSCQKNNEMLQNVQSSLVTNDWLIISHDLTEGFLHCDLKANNVLVSKGLFTSRRVTLAPRVTLARGLKDSPGL